MTMTVTGTHFAYYQLCQRKLWFFANGINMEQTSDLVYVGKLIHEESYLQRSSRYEEVAIDGIKVDYYDPKNRIIHEIKKSNKVDHAHEWQLKYYIYVFEQHGLKNVRGLLEYPALRKTNEVFLSGADRNQIRRMIVEIEGVMKQEECPPLTRKGICRNCSYYEFCYAGEPSNEDVNKTAKKVIR